PHGELEALLQQDVAWLQIDDIYLIRPTPQCATNIATSDVVEGPPVAAAERVGEPIIAMLAGLPMENHPHLRGNLIVDDPDDWAALYQVMDRKHGTAMASLILRGGNGLSDLPLEQPLYVRPILRAERDAFGVVRETPPRSRLWLDVIHQAVRRILAADVL